MTANTKQTRRAAMSAGMLVLLAATLITANWNPGHTPAPGATNPAGAPAAIAGSKIGPTAGGNAQAPLPAGAVPRQTRPGGALISSDVKHDVSPPLRSIPPAKLQPTLGDDEIEFSTLLPNKSPRQAKDPVVQRSFGPGLLAMPAPLRSFEGVNNIAGVLPPDTNGDVGPNHYVQWVNLHLKIFDKNGNTLYGPVPGNTLWTGFGGVCESTNNGDPIAIYDSMADRWVLSQFAVPGGSRGYHQCVAVSTSPDPTGSYYRYDFFQSQTVFSDYPHFGVWPDAYYVSYNMFNVTSSGTSFAGPRAEALDRAQMLVGQQASQQFFDLSSANDPQLPSDLDGNNLPPAGAANVFASVDVLNLTLDFFNFHVDWNNPANTTFVKSATLNPAPFVPLCLRRQDCIPEPAPAPPAQPSRLDALATRLMYRLAYRNLGDHESLVLNHTVDASANQAGIRWYEVRTPRTPAIYQQGTYAPDTDHRWMGSAAMDRQGNMAIGYSVSSLTTYPSIRYAGRLSGDPLGTLPQGENTLIAGTGVQLSTAYRWGDYAMLSIDPTDDCTFWYTSEYYQTTSDRGWQTRIGAFKFPGCLADPPTSTPTGTPPTATRTVTPQQSFTPTMTRTPTNTPIVACSTTVINGSITASDALQVARLGRDDSPSTCEGKRCPGALGQGTRHYDQYTFYNNSGNTQCVTVRLDTPCDGTTNPIFSAAYLGSYDPTNLCTNYLGDIGNNPPQRNEYLFNVPNGATYVIIVNEVNQDTGCPNYTLTVSCGVAGGTPTRTATNTGTPPTATSTRTPTNTVTPTPTPTSLGCGITQPLLEGFESGTLGVFTTTGTLGSTRWVASNTAANSGTYSAFGANPNETSDYNMAMKNAVAIPADATQAVLKFAHRWRFEQPDYDGGVLEVSIDGGTLWTDAGANITQGGYTGVITATSGNPLAGRAAYVNESPGYPAFITTTVNLVPYAGQSVKFRWRIGSDLNTFANGWWVDDVSIRITQPCQPSATPTSTATFTPTNTPTLGTPTPTPTVTRTPTPEPCGTASDYIITEQSGASIVPGTTLVAGSQCDDCMSDISIPFNVLFYGQARNYIAAGSNGDLAFYCCNSTSSNVCLPANYPSLLDVIFAHWDDLDMSAAGCGPSCGIYTSVTGVAPYRVLHVEYRAKRKSLSGDVNFEVRLYEGQSKFDIIYNTVAGNGSGATVGVQKDNGNQFFTQYECNFGGLTSGLQLTFTQRPCPSALLVGHVTWQGRPDQPSPLQSLPITLTLKFQTDERSYTNLTTDASGFFTAPVGGLLGTYQYRAKGPQFLAGTGAVVLTGVAQTNAEMGPMLTGDCNNDNTVGLQDFAILKTSFGKTLGDPGYDARADLTGDNTVTVQDFSLLRTNYGLTGPPPIRPTR